MISYEMITQPQHNRNCCTLYTRRPGIPLEDQTLARLDFFFRALYTQTMWPTPLFHQEIWKLTKLQRFRWHEVPESIFGSVVPFLADQNRSIGDLVPWSVRLLPLSEFSQHYRVTPETFDLWDIWSEWGGDMTWPKKDNDKDKYKDKDNDKDKYI